MNILEVVQKRMSNYKVHIAFGIIMSMLAWFIFINIEYTFFFLYIPVIIFYSILPDIDHDSSVARKFVFITLILIKLGLIVLYIIFREMLYLWMSASIVLLMLLTYFLKHRGFTHKIGGVILFSLPLLLINFTAFYLGLFAYLSHLLIDKL